MTFQIGIIIIMSVYYEVRKTQVNIAAYKIE